MKLSKEELKQKISDLVEDDEKSIELLEDIEDSFIETTTNTELEETKRKYEELKEKYKKRFLYKEEKEEKEDKDEEDFEELEEKKYIDIKEI